MKSPDQAIWGNRKNSIALAAGIVFFMLRLINIFGSLIGHNGKAGLANPFPGSLDTSTIL